MALDLKENPLPWPNDAKCAVAIPRILKMYRHCDIKQTFFYPAG